MPGVERFYSFEEIAARATCLEWATTVLGLTPVRGTKDYFNIPWRAGSDSGALHILPHGWVDFTQPDGSPDHSGGVIDLHARVKGIDLQEAQQEIGDLLHLEPKMLRGKEQSRSYQDLIDQGYQEARRWTYQNEDGTPAHVKIRFEHPDLKKEFLQQAPDGRSSLKGIRKVLYRLPEWISLQSICLAEGEKCADAIAAMGLPATTNTDGAVNWEAHYDDWLAGKRVVIFEDNDEPGRQRTALLCARLHGKAAELRIVRYPDQAKGFDVADWLAAGNGRDELLAAIKAAPAFQPNDTALAKELNKEPLRNFLVDKDDEGKQVFRPRHLLDLIQEVQGRFLGFPRRIGDVLFDHDRGDGTIRYIRSQQQLCSWMQIKSKQAMRWKKGEGFAGKEELYEALAMQAQRYEAIHQVPDWPRRSDVYYTFGELPKPTDDLGTFTRLVNYFHPASPCDAMLIAALFCAPLYYEPSIQRPMWIIDSETSQSGKTTLASMVSELYLHPPVEVKTRDLARDTQEITKRLVSSEGRQAKIVLIDNVDHTLHSQELAAFVTMPYITGRPSYGKNEECRPNNLTWILTANNAATDNDLSIRSFVIRLARPAAYDPTWKRTVLEFIHRNRMQILADIIAMLERHQPFPKLRPVTRFPEFEELILQPCCQTEEAYGDLIKHLLNARAETNVDEERGKQIEDVLRDKLAELKLGSAYINPETTPIFIQSAVAEAWISAQCNFATGNVIGTVRSMAREGHCPSIHPKIQAWPYRGPGRRRGLLWRPGGDDNARPELVIKMQSGKPAAVVEGGSPASDNWA